MGRKIGIISAKGGVGKNIITINLASALMSLSKNVIAVDADGKLSGLSLQLGMYHFPVTLDDVLKQGKPILESLYIHSTGLRIIPASLGMKKGPQLNRLKKVLEDPSLHDNIILIDCPPGLESNALSVIRACDEAIVVTTPEIPAVADMLKTLALLKKSGSKILGVIVNRYRNVNEQVRISEIQAACGVPILGVIKEDSLMTKSVFRRTPAVVIAPFARSSLEFKRIAAGIAGERFKKPSYLPMRRLLWRK